MAEELGPALAPRRLARGSVLKHSAPRRSVEEARGTTRLGAVLECERVDTV